MSFVGIAWELGVCMFSGLDEDGFPIAQFDATGADPQVEAVELHHPFGFASRPRDPEVDNDGQPKEGKACNMWFGTEGNTMHAILAFDPRYISTFPRLGKGGSMQYCAAGSFRVMDGDNGTETLYVPVPGNKAHVQTVGLDGNGTPYVGLLHADGMGITMLSNSVVMKNAAGDAYVEANASGLNLNGNTTIVGSLVVGPVGAMAAAKAQPVSDSINAIAGALDTLAAACNGIAPGTTAAIAQITGPLRAMAPTVFATHTSIT